MRTRRRLRAKTWIHYGPSRDVPNRGSRTSEITDLILLEHIDVGFPTRGGRGQPHLGPYDLPARCGLDAPVAARSRRGTSPRRAPDWGRFMTTGKSRTAVVDLGASRSPHPHTRSRGGAGMQDSIGDQLREMSRKLYRVSGSTRRARMRRVSRARLGTFLSALSRISINGVAYGARPSDHLHFPFDPLDIEEAANPRFEVPGRRTVDVDEFHRSAAFLTLA